MIEDQRRTKPFRFRTDRDPRGTDQMHRHWQARYSHRGGWCQFEVAIDLERETCSFYRVGGTNYEPLLYDLARSLLGDRVTLPDAPEPAARVTLDASLVGLRMGRATAGLGTPADPAGVGPFRPDPNGDWLVVRAFVPRGQESFLLGVSDRVGSGEIVITQPGSGVAVLRALYPAFG